MGAKRHKSLVIYKLTKVPGVAREIKKYIKKILYLFLKKKKVLTFLRHIREFPQQMSAYSVQPLANFNTYTYIYMSKELYYIDVMHCKN